MISVITACSDGAITGVLSSVKKIMLFLQIIVPILLIVWTIIGLIHLLQNPDEKMV